MNKDVIIKSLLSKFNDLIMNDDDDEYCYFGVDDCIELLIKKYGNDYPGVDWTEQDEAGL